MAEEDRDDLENQYEEGGEQETEEEYVSAEEYKNLQEQLRKLQESNKKANKEAQKRRHKLNEYEERLKNYELDPDNPDELEEALKTYKQKTESGQEEHKQPDIEKIKKQFEQEKQKEIEKYDQQLRQMEKSVNKYLVDSQANAAISEYDGVPKLLMPHIRENVAVQTNENGEYVTRVLDEDGDPRFNNNGEYMGIRDLVAEMRESEDYGMAFKAKASSGSGSSPSSNKSNSKGAPKNKSRSQMTNKEKETYIKNYGSDEYFNLPV